MDLKYSACSQALFNETEKNNLSSNMLYSNFMNSNYEFPYYDLGSILKKYFEKEKIDADDKEALRTFYNQKSRDRCISLKKIEGILENTTFLTREETIQLCYFFNLTPNESDNLLLDFRQCAFHYRSFDDFIHAFHLKMHCPYENALAMINHYKQKYCNRPATDRNINYGGQAKPGFITESTTATLKAKLHENNFTIESLTNILDEDGRDQFSDISLTATNLYFKLIEDIKHFIENPPFQDTYGILCNAPIITHTDLCRLISGDTHAVKDPAMREAFHFNTQGFLSNNAELYRYKQLRKKLSRNNLLIVILCHISTIDIADWESQWHKLKPNKQAQRSLRQYCFIKAVDFTNNVLTEANFPPLHPRVPLDYIILSTFKYEDPHEHFVSTWKSFFDEP